MSYTPTVSEAFGIEDMMEKDPEFPKSWLWHWSLLGHVLFPEVRKVTLSTMQDGQCAQWGGGRSLAPARKKPWIPWGKKEVAAMWPRCCCEVQMCRSNTRVSHVSWQPLPPVSFRSACLYFQELWIIASHRAPEPQSNTLGPLVASPSSELFSLPFAANVRADPVPSSCIVYVLAFSSRDLSCPGCFLLYM